LSRFVCSICGQEHEGLARDWAFKLPDEVWAIPESERAERARYDTDLCQLEERYFIRCILPVPLLEEDGAFCWGVWAEVEEFVFHRYLEIYEEDGSDEPRRRGKLANALRPYPRSFARPVDIQFGISTQRPTLSLLDDDDCSLAIEQRSGIASARHHEILSLLSKG
jgi:hypothetical protein